MKPSLPLWMRVRARSIIRKTTVQTEYFRPISAPLLSDPEGKPLLQVRSMPPRLVEGKVPQPGFPMSNGNHPTPSRQYKLGTKRIGLLGVKMGMTAMWDEFGRRIPLTVLHIADNEVVCNKPYGYYWTVQVGAINVSPEKMNRSLLFHYRRFRVAPKRITREFQVHHNACLPSGFKLNAAHFVAGQFVDVFGISKGKGFQGVMKRHGFSGGNASHGASLSHRTPGSIGTNKTVGRVHKGKRMAGRMGGVKRHVRNLRVMKVDPHKNLIYVSGPIPGSQGSILKIKDARWKIRHDTCFPKNTKVPFPTFMGNPRKLPLELTPPAPTLEEMKVDPFLNQRAEIHQ